MLTVVQTPGTNGGTSDDGGVDGWTCRTRGDKGDNTAVHTCCRDMCRGLGCVDDSSDPVIGALSNEIYLVE